MIVPTSTVSPSLNKCFPIKPSDGAGTSMATLSVSRATIGSSASTLSPGFFSHFPIVASDIDSPSSGF